MQKKVLNIELGLIDDITKMLDETNNSRRQLVTQGLKVSNDLSGLTSNYQKIISLSIDAANKAKELGLTDVEKSFRVRGAEAKDYLDTIGKVSNTVAASLRSI